MSSTTTSSTNASYMMKNFKAFGITTRATFYFILLTLQFLQCSSQLNLVGQNHPQFPISNKGIESYISSLESQSGSAGGPQFNKNIGGGVGLLGTGSRETASLTSMPGAISAMLSGEKFEEDGGNKPKPQFIAQRFQQLQLHQQQQQHQQAASQLSAQFSPFSSQLLNQNPLQQQQQQQFNQNPLQQQFNQNPLLLQQQLLQQQQQQQQLFQNHQNLGGLGGSGGLQANSFGSQPNPLLQQINGIGGLNNNLKGPGGILGSSSALSAAYQKPNGNGMFFYRSGEDLDGEIEDNAKLSDGNGNSTISSESYPTSHDNKDSNSTTSTSTSSTKSSSSKPKIR